jgi:methylamine utilization protein MauE
MSRFAATEGGAVLGVLCAAAALLLVGSGAAKIRAPMPTVDMFVALVPALRTRRRRLRPPAAAAGALEIAAGACLIVTGARAAAVAVALLYLIFAAVAVRLTARSTSTSCGCFGRTDAPVGLPHVILDVVACAVASAAVVVPVGFGDGLLAAGGAETVVRCLQAVLVAWLGYLAITALPALSAARTRLEA